MNMFSLKDKIVMITGGAGHLGEAMTDILCEYGAIVIIASRNEQKNLELKTKLESKYESEILVVKLDISDKNLIEEEVKQIVKRYGKIDVLINNSYYGAGEEFLKMTDDEWNIGIDGSINSCYRVSQVVLKYMKKLQKGKIINIASMYGMVAPDVSIYEGNEFYNPANYGVGKAGIIQLTKYIAAVYGKYGITCNSISPGPFPNLKVQENKEFIENLSRKVPLGRVGRPDDLKGVILMLASNTSDYINGANIVVDGGWTIW